MATHEPRIDDEVPSSRRARGPGVVELVQKKIEEVAAEAEWALGSEEGLEHEWVEGVAADDDEEEGEGFLEDVARAIEQTLWDDERDEKSGGPASEPRPPR
ncbi:MAG TPA: hypothetical protein VFS43_15970 [Polyangiaceae bacterium]|nr:hypothetical protein [Polyangiaceae bacterium]